MLQGIIDRPWIFIAFVVLIAVLRFAALARIRRDRMRRHRAKVNRRNMLRADRDRRWKTRD